MSLTAKQKRLIEKGCVVCRKYEGVYSNAQAHHVRTLATSKKRKNSPIIGLCPWHHIDGGKGVAVHAGRKSWEANYGPEIDYIEWEEQ